MMQPVYISTTYLGPVQQYCKLFQYPEVHLETAENYLKQTFRNRCTIAAANGPLALSIPIVKPDTLKCPTKDIRISDHGNWRHLHWNALVSAYNMSPFFEYYEEDFAPFYEKKYEFLFDYNEELRQLICRLLDLHPNVIYTEEYQSNLCGYKVNMTWFQVTQRAANAYIDTYLEDVSGINTISPTWYSIADGTGELSSLASDTFVCNMHARGLKVWPLVNDFNNNVDYAAFYSSKTARTKLINNLMQEARQYGYDGYNIDFEYVKKDFADDYLQFLRELSIACQNNGLVLSVDNYKPANHNAHYELAEQAVFVDYIVIMGYDEHYAGSDAGSVASLPFVEDGISRAVSMVPSEQVINAVPFYTRIWTENAGETKSRAVGMKAAMDAMQENGATAEWDETTGQYYCTYETSAGTVQIWFEEDRSIGEKMKLYSKYKLGGVAEWKLGLETSSVWSIISNGLNYAS